MEFHRIRKFRKMTQMELKEKTGISQTSISHIELGKQMPEANTIEKLSEALGCSVVVEVKLNPDCKHVWPIAPNDGKKFRCIECNELWAHTEEV